MPARSSRWRELLRGHEVGVAYALLVLAVTVVLLLAPAATRDAVVQGSSTNLVNLRQRPLSVLLASAFVEQSAAGLLLLPPLLVAYSTLQRWLGVAVTVLVGLLGHVGATLFVAVMIEAGIEHGWVSLAIATESDVGVSFGLASVAALLVARLPRRWAWWYGTAGSVALAALLGARRTYTDLGHVTAWSIGLVLALLVHRVRVASQRA